MSNEDNARYLSMTEGLKMLGTKNTSAAGGKLATAYDWFPTLFGRQLGAGNVSDNRATVTHEGVALRIQRQTDGGSGLFLLHEDDVYKAAGKKKPSAENTPKATVTKATVQNGKGAQAATAAADEYITLGDAMLKERGKRNTPRYLIQRLHLLYEQVAKKEHVHTSYEGLLTVQSHDETIRLHASWYGQRLKLKVHKDDTAALDSVAQQMADEGLQKRAKFHLGLIARSGKSEHGL